MNSLFKASAAATAMTVLAAGFYIATPLSAGFLASPPFLWVAANVIIIWLLSSSRRKNTVAADASSAGHADDVLSAVDELYPSSDYEGFAGVVPTGDEAPVVSKPKRLAREARAAARRTDRARVPKKSAGEAASRTAAGETRRPDAGDRKRGDEAPRTAAGTRPEDGGDDDVSIDTLWQSIVQRRAARPVAVKKSETWGSDELPRLRRVADTAAERREMRKSMSSAAAPPPPPPQEPAPSAARQLGWRTREVLMTAHDDLLRRAESLIRRHHEDLRLQRQESEQRQAMELQRGRPALIRV